MKTKDFSLQATKNGGKITAFNYSRRLNELCGSWSANAVNGTFTAGETISFKDVMTNGIIAKARKDSSGLWHIEGYDAGIRLIEKRRNTPSFSYGDISRNMVSV